MQIEHIELSPDQTKAKVTTINGFWFSATKITETYRKYDTTWVKDSTKTFAPVWISLAIKRLIEENYHE